MKDFITILKEVLKEQDKDIDCLFESGVISKNTFYKYRQRMPSLKTLLKLANFLEVSVDFIFEKSYENNFSPYLEDQSKFYEKLLKLIKNSNISNRKFCKDLNYSKDNILRYKNGVEPSVRTLLEISNYFGCNIDDLLTKKFK